MPTKGIFHPVALQVQDFLVPYTYCIKTPVHISYWHFKQPAPYSFFKWISWFMWSIDYIHVHLLINHWTFPLEYKQSFLNKEFAFSMFKSSICVVIAGIFFEKGLRETWTCPSKWCSVPYGRLMHFRRGILQYSGTQAFQPATNF